MHTAVPFACLTGEFYTPLTFTVCSKMPSLYQDTPHKTSQRSCLHDSPWQVIAPCRYWLVLRVRPGVGDTAITYTSKVVISDACSKPTDVYIINWWTSSLLRVSKAVETAGKLGTSRTNGEFGINVDVSVQVAPQAFLRIYSWQKERKISPIENTMQQGKTLVLNT